ncbi:5'-3' exonuclease isoform X2 [Phoenix dactylifera]|uniref:5'-3' exonuclease isoform X2 n=1 Tax=Phoenix dactylifera TaxID=42345 RepID=A0A8B9AHQ0_PHODC|nr:5'-3' exonuclease isoform X2 [Phoenix dactylifera]
MACCRLSYNHISSFWRTIDGIGGWIWASPMVGSKMLCGRLPMHLRYGSITLSRKGCSKLAIFPKFEPLIAAQARHLQSDPLVSSEDLRTTRPIKADSSKLSKSDASVDLLNNRVMLVDGTAIMYRSYYKLIAKLHRGLLEHADGNGDWVLTIFTALSLLFDVLEFMPSHVAVIFDHDGVPFGHTTTMPSKESYMAKGLTFRHMLYPSYKSSRIPTPDTVVQGLQYLKASIKAMSIKVIEVPGVEADDVIGTLAVNSVSAGYKVRIVSPDKDFFQILSPSLRLLRIASRGSGMVSFGLEDFAKRYGALQPSQFVDVVALAGDKSDNIPGVEGIGHVNALKLITRFDHSNAHALCCMYTQVPWRICCNVLIKLRRNVSKRHCYQVPIRLFFARTWQLCVPIFHHTWFHLKHLTSCFRNRRTMEKNG